MPKVYLSYTHKDADIARKIGAELSARGHEILIDSAILSLGEDWRRSLMLALKSADGVIVLVTNNSTESNYVISEVGMARAFISESENKKFLIPVFYEDVEIPNILQDLLGARLRQDNFAQVIEEIDTVISRYIGQNEALKENQSRARERIESNATDYIDIATTTLKAREVENKRIAIACYLAGFVMLLGGAYFAYTGLKRITDLIQHDAWVYTIAILKSFTVIGLFIACSKYAFDLGKSFMHEALKSADRIHAIAFGKFYLQAFGDKITSPKDVVEVFQNWNLDNANSSFSKLDANTYDPKFAEKLIEIAKNLSEKVKPDK